MTTPRTPRIPPTTNPTDAPTIELAARIRELRLRRGLTIQACAHATGVNRDTWRSWEHARTRPRLIHAQRIARALNEPIAALFAEPNAICLPDITITPTRAQALTRATHADLENLTHALAHTLTTHLAAELHLRATNHHQRGTRSTSRAAVPSSPAAVRARIEARRDALEAGPEEG